MKELKEAIKENKGLIIGTQRTLKKLKMKEVKKVYASSNCPKEVLEDIEHYTKLYNIPLVKLEETNEELGIICKKPFHISVLSLE
ncbi:ribosomal L7Ae/L30e/S12e/Gadd45 family protein [Candidatus Woesearchaeota archaeon]|nr:ribosomal L7Ae/L30e/S12e/Gadd45 family protein [Candidatus Woesearchaeota archaeon]